MSTIFDVNKFKLWFLPIILIIIVGCSSTSSNVKNSDDAQEQVLKIGYLPVLHHLPLMIADGQGKLNGIKVQPVKFSDWASLSEALKSGQIDGAFINNAVGLKALEQGYDGKIVALTHRDVESLLFLIF